MEERDGVRHQARGSAQATLGPAGAAHRQAPHAAPRRGPGEAARRPSLRHLVRPAHRRAQCRWRRRRRVGRPRGPLGGHVRRARAAGGAGVGPVGAGADPAGPGAAHARRSHRPARAPAHRSRQPGARDHHPQPGRRVGRRWRQRLRLSRRPPDPRPPRSGAGPARRHVHRCAHLAVPLASAVLRHGPRGRRGPAAVVGRRAARARERVPVRPARHVAHVPALGPRRAVPDRGRPPPVAVGSPPGSSPPGSPSTPSSTT